MRGYLYLRVLAWLFGLPLGVSLLLGISWEWSLAISVSGKTGDIAAVGHPLLFTASILLAIAGRSRKGSALGFPFIAAAMNIGAMIWMLRETKAAVSAHDLFDLSTSMVFIGAVWLDGWASRTLRNDDKLRFISGYRVASLKERSWHQ